ncbi:MAG: sigma-70 family RNA polymerase sigma factor [Gemmataceae bacterium]|nr:sigma-70 family RNA polymerase sigma factor [Gemmataceae bacterium]
MSSNQFAGHTDDDLLALARHGSAAALEALFERCRDLVIRVVRQRLNWPLRRLVDSVDILQDVEVELCDQPVPMAALQSRESWIGYLCVLALHKLAESQRHYEAQRRSLDRDVPLECVPALPQPTAAAPEGVSARERLDLVERGLSRVPRAIFRLLRVGHTHAAIATRLHISERTVERYVRKLKSLPPPPQ